jgi:hypothetical protein
MANRNYPKNVSATTVIPFDNPITYIPPKTITGAVTFTKSTTGAQAGYGAIIEVTADGTHIPDVSAFSSVGTGTYDNTAGVVNLFTFFYTGQRYVVAINPISGAGLIQLSTPAAFTATPSGSSVVLNWSDVSNESGYKVYWSGVNDFGSAALATTTAANAGTYTKTGLSSGPWYFWVVAAGDGVTYSDSNPASASATVTSGATALNAPTGVTLGTATDVTQPLTWTDTNTSPNENGYKVYRNTANNFSTATLETTTAANATSYTVTGLTASTLYYYWVVAQGNGTTTADSSPSTVASGSTGAAAEDAYTTAWATASGVAAGSYRTAVDTFVKALRTASILTTHFDFLHILCGGSEAAVKLNLIDPTDADASYRLTFNNSATFAATGVTGNGTNQTISTHFIPGLAAKMGLNDSHVALYHRTSAGADNPAWGINQTSKQIYLFPKESGGAGAFRYTNQSNISFTPTNAKGFWVARKNTTNISLYKDGVVVNDALDNGNAEVLSPDYDIVFNGWNNNGTPALAHAGELSIISGGKYLNDTQRAAYESAVANLATALGL